ncbi:LacI family transcriptional regulator [Spinactinospora alkalitolerans]|uniref:LacI family transcriptional regulator n=1 Tax=Spinactinospora alkalitolerans TaxID=687207 RepID=A0A852U7V0_9ACTN|nr:LacI family DNA-binding transcriptional regulator [Spinactinospora alkalitolerans]NYE50144.1 LacI family transcriptional regulator [Spinactinospora alkalitolerans]
MPTISDVASRAGVSPATASRVLNGKSTVAPDLAQRVQAAAAELQYRPNGLARNLRRRETTVIALIIGDVENPFFTSLARGVEDAAHAEGYSVILCNSDEDAAKERRYVDVALQERAAGVVLSSTGSTESIGMLRDQRIPFVAVDRPVSGAPTDTAVVDTRSAAAAATRHMIEQGYERIGCIAGPAGIATADDRLEGYRDALRAAGRRVPARLVRHSEFKAAGARSAAMQLLDRRERPDALLVANCVMARGVLEAMAELGLHSGRDVGLAAFDDDPWTTLITPPMTVIAQPAYDLGLVSTRMLLSRIAAPERAATTTTLHATLVPRGSTQR